MATVIIPQRFWMRRDTPSNWSTVNPVLALAEIGIETYPSAADFRMKIGDGVTAWNSLAYFGGNIAFRVDSGYIQVSKDGGSTWQNLIAVSALQGPQGPQGNPGANGSNGTNGLSAYQVAVANGFAGTVGQWLASLVGPQGDQGIQGPPGIPSQRRIQEIANTATGSVTCDWNSYDEIRVVLTSNTTFTMSGALPGQGCILKLKQDGTGGRTATFGAEVRFNSLITSFTASTIAGKADKIGFQYDDQDGYYDVVSVVPGI